MTKLLGLTHLWAGNYYAFAKLNFVVKRQKKAQLTSLDKLKEKKNCKSVRVKAAAMKENKEKEEEMSGQNLKLWQED